MSYAHSVGSVSFSWSGGQARYGFRCGSPPLEGFWYANCPSRAGSLLPISWICSGLYHEMEKKGKRDHANLGDQAAAVNRKMRDRPISVILRSGRQWRYDLGDRGTVQVSDLLSNHERLGRDSERQAACRRISCVYWLCPCFINGSHHNNARALGPSEILPSRALRRASSTGRRQISISSVGSRWQSPSSTPLAK
jgi:hypothetical protein